MKYLGIDYGKKHVGLAISNSEGTVAVAYKTIANKDLLGQVLSIHETESIDAYVIGHSHDLHGNDNAIQKQINEFVVMLQEKSGIPAHLHTEVLTSMQAKWGTEKNIRREHRDDKSKTQKGRIDAQAATIMLQSYLDSNALL